MSTCKMYRTLRCVVEVEACIEYSYYDGCKGAREGGLQLEPDEDACCEIESITATDAAFVVKGDDLELADEAQWNELAQEALEDIISSRQDAMEDYFDSRNDR